MNTSIADRFPHLSEKFPPFLWCLRFLPSLAHRNFHNYDHTFPLRFKAQKGTKPLPLRIFFLRFSANTISERLYCSVPAEKMPPRRSDRKKEPEIARFQVLFCNFLGKTRFFLRRSGKRFLLSEHFPEESAVRRSARLERHRRGNKLCGFRAGDAAAHIVVRKASRLQDAH